MPAAGKVAALVAAAAGTEMDAVGNCQNTALTRVAGGVVVGQAGLGVGERAPSRATTMVGPSRSRAYPSVDLVHARPIGVRDEVPPAAAADTGSHLACTAEKVILSVANRRISLFSHGRSRLGVHSVARTWSKKRERQFFCPL